MDSKRNRRAIVKKDNQAPLKDPQGTKYPQRLSRPKKAKTIPGVKLQLDAVMG
jgi:hypothetical protein